MVAGIMQMAGILMVGVFAASWWGYGLLNPLFFTGFAGVSFLLAGPAVLAGQRIALAVARACGATGLMLGISLVTLNRGSPVEQLLLPEPATIFDAALFSIAMAGFGASATVLLMRRLSPNRSRWVLRGALAAGLLGFTRLPARWTYAGMDAVLSWGLTPAVLVLTACLGLIAVWFARLARKQVATIQA